MGQRPAILQVVGYKNSGKTTLIEKLVRRATQEGLRVATIKHHGHGGTPEAVGEGKDSMRHFEAGAVVSSVEGSGVLQLCAEIGNWGLEEIIRLYEHFSIDVIFVEGDKQEDYPKVVMIRDEGDLDLLKTLTNVKCVISHKSLNENLVQGYRLFHLDEDEQYVGFFMGEMEGT